MCLVACLVVWLCYSYIPVWQPELYNLNTLGEIWDKMAVARAH